MRAALLSNPFGQLGKLCLAQVILDENFAYCYSRWLKLHGVPIFVVFMESPIHGIPITHEIAIVA